MTEALPPKTDPEMAVRWFRTWFGDDYPKEYAIVSQMMPKNGRTVTRHRSGTPHEVAELFETVGMDDLVYERGNNWNLYMSVGVMGEKPPAGRKGGRRDVTRVPGIWVDLDTDKSGFFDDEEHCLRLLRELPPEVWPNIVVATGTGGVHGYWKTDEPLNPEEAERLCTMWWCYLSSRTTAKIDKLINADRVMKLPGSIRWPKSEFDSPALVRLLHADDARRVSVNDIEEHATDAYDAYVRDIKERRERVQRNRLEATRAAGELASTGKWGLYMTLATIEDQFNIEYDWEDILVPLGWTKLDQDNEGRDIWARPGLASHELHKSAATNYQDSHVMTLFSDSEETGLSHLLDTGTTLTKYRVWVEVKYGGDEAAFVRDYLENDHM